MLDSLKNWIYDFKQNLRLFERSILHSSDPSVTIVMTKKNVSHDCDDQEKRTYARTMTHYGLNDCRNLSNIIDIMNRLTPPTICSLYSSKSKDIQSLNICSDINDMR